MSGRIGQRKKGNTPLNRKRFWMVLCLVPCLLLCGCKTNKVLSPESRQLSHRFGNEGDVELHIMVPVAGEGMRDFWSGYQEAFMQENEGIVLQMEYVDVGMMDVTLEAMTKAKSLPDIILTDALPTLMEEEALVPIFNLMSKGFLNNMVPGFLEATKTEETLYGLPACASTMGLFTNDHLLEEAEIQGAPSTWEDLERILRLLEGKYATDVLSLGVSLQPQHALASLTAIAYAQGGGYLDAQNNWSIFSEPNLSTFLAVDNLLKQHSFVEEKAKLSVEALYEAFLTEQIAMVIMPSTAKGLWDKPVSFHPIPSSNPQEANSLLFLDSFFVCDNDNEPIEGSLYTKNEAIERFFTFFYQEESYRMFLETGGYLPATKGLMRQMEGEHTLTASIVESLFEQGNLSQLKAKMYPKNEKQWSYVKEQIPLMSDKALAGVPIDIELQQLQESIEQLQEEE